MSATRTYVIPVHVTVDADTDDKMRADVIYEGTTGRDIGGVPFSDPPIARHELVWENLRLRLGQAAERAMTDTDDPADVYDEKYVNVGVVERFDTSTDPDCGL